MASTVWAFQVTIPAGGTILADTPMPEGTVEEIVITVPPGPSGLVGLQLWVKGGQAQPVQQGAWFIADDRIISLKLAGQPDSGAWQLNGYNTDIYPHTIGLEYYVTPAGAVTAASAADAVGGPAGDLLNLAGDTEAGLPSEPLPEEPPPEPPPPPPARQPPGQVHGKPPVI